MNGFFTELEASHLFKAACLTRPRESLFFAFSPGVATYAATLSFFIRMLEI